MFWICIGFTVIRVHWIYSYLSSVLDLYWIYCYLSSLDLQLFVECFGFVLDLQLLEFIGFAVICKVFWINIGFTVI